jgi:hypothetical protein
MDMIASNVQSIQRNGAEITHLHDGVSDDPSGSGIQKLERSLPHLLPSIDLQSGIRRNETALAAANMIEAAPLVAREVSSIRSERQKEDHKKEVRERPGFSRTRVGSTPHSHAGLP